MDVFPLRWGSQSPSCKGGSLLVPYSCERAPATVRQGGDVDLTFDNWAGPTLPTFADHVSDAQKEIPSSTGVFPPCRHVPDCPAVLPDPLGFGVPSTVAVPPPLHLPTATTMPYVGATFMKDFGHHGVFKGEVKEYDAETSLYRVVYSDGDLEDLTTTELLQLWQPPPISPSPTHTQNTSGHVHDRSASEAVDTGSIPVATDTGSVLSLPSGPPNKPERKKVEPMKKVQNVISGTGDKPKRVQFSLPASHDSTSSGSHLDHSAMAPSSPIDPSRLTRSSRRLRSRKTRKKETDARYMALHKDDASSSGVVLSPTAPSFVPASPSIDGPTVLEIDVLCQALARRQFIDPKLGACTITHWDTECGQRRIFYRPDDDITDVHHASLSAVQAWVARGDIGAVRSPGTQLYFRKLNGCFGYPIEAVSSTAVTANIKCLDSKIQSSIVPADVSRWPLVPIKISTLRRILKADMSIFKYGIYVPRNDRDAARSPESIHWKAGRRLEWLRLLKVNAFEGNWTKESMLRAFPHMKLSDIGHVFFIYDYKHSGEFKVRLVYDGSRQPESTCGETFAPTVQPESIRLFHLYCVEHGYDIGQYDVPQAFLQAEAEGDIFFYPPPGCADFPGQIFKCIRNLYGGKSAARLYYLRFVEFLTSLGFEADTMDPCFFRRREPSGLFTLLICHVDDSRIGAPPAILEELYQALFVEFQVTVADGTRFLGMDMEYDKLRGVLKLHMQTYIQETVARFESCDTTVGYPYRQIVGCILWQCTVHGGDLMRAKQLASRCNDFGPEDFAAAMELLYRLRDRGDKGIIFRRGGYSRVRVPDNRRLKGEDGTVTPYYEGADDLIDEFGQKDLYRQEDADADDAREQPDFPVSDRFKLVAYTDASFAVNEKMQSITGWVIYLNGTPIMWGSMRQTVVVDSSCSAEYVAASVTVKKMKELENRLLFLEIRCARPYTLYTDSQAAKAIAENTNSMGNVRHLDIRTHMTRCYISLGDIALAFCVTEQMVADLFTKIVTAGQESNLLDRFYNDCTED